MQADQQGHGAPAAAAASSAPLGVLELMRVPAARGCCCSAFAIGTLVYTLTPRAPSYFMSELGVSALRTGQLLALPPVVMQATDLLTGALEALLLGRGWQQLTVRKLISCSGEDTYTSTCAHDLSRLFHSREITGEMHLLCRGKHRPANQLKNMMSA